jgi:hypothetical protein
MEQDFALGLEEASCILGNHSQSSKKSSLASHGARVQRFERTVQLRSVLPEFRKNLNEQWIIQRLGYQTPAQARRNACSPPQKVA